MTADRITRAAEVILNNGARAIRDGSAWTSPQDDEQIMEDCRDIAQALVDAGLLVTPERDAEVRADERAKVLADVDNIARASSLSATDVRLILDAIGLEWETRAMFVGPHDVRLRRRLVGPWEATP